MIYYQLFYEKSEEGEGKREISNFKFQISSFKFRLDLIVTVCWNVELQLNSFANSLITNLLVHHYTNFLTTLEGKSPKRIRTEFKLFL